MRAGAQTLLDLRADLPLIVQNLGRRGVGYVGRAEANQDMTVAGRHQASLGLWFGRCARAEIGYNSREVAPLYVVGIATKVFGREFPVARHDPFVHAANDLDASFAAVEERIQIPGHLAQIFAQRRRLRVESGKQQSLVTVELRYRLEAPALALQFVVIGFLEPRHAGK